MNVKMLARLTLVGLFACVLSLFSQAQNKTITGKVTDSKDGSALAGASIVVKGSKLGSQTGADGTFKISVPTSATKLVVSSVGFANQEVSISDATSVSISLKATSDQLGEVVVVGYGTRKVKDLTGSVASLTTKDFNKGMISSPDQMIQGRTPGVIVTPSSGEPGAGVTINIRGSASIRGNNDPLYVVDGVPLDGGGTSDNAGGAGGVEGGSTAKNPLIFLNPNDIESISILKDASSAAIYGSRGANGVVIITTKNGKGNKGAFSFSANTSVSQAAKKYDLLDAQTFLLGVKKANIDAGTSPSDAAAAVTSVDKGANTNWQDQILQTGISQSYNLGWGFNKKNTSLRLSGSYDYQVGIVKNSVLKRATGRANFTQKFLNDRAKLEATLTYSNVKNQYAPNSNSAGYQGSLIGAAIAFNPTYPIKNADGTYFDPRDGNRNPVEMLNYFDARDNINRLLTNVSLSYKILSSLTYKATVGYDNSKSKRNDYADPRLSGNAFGGNNNVFGVDYQNPISGNGRGFQQDLTVKSLLVEHTLTYDKSFKNGHDINAVAGYSYQSSETEGSAIVAWGLATPVVAATDVFVKDMNNFKNSKAGYIPFYSKNELQSYFGRVNYTINNKYYFTATVRMDGSSKFGTNNKYGTFPALAAKWKLINEDFAAKSLGKLFNEFSIRANYGKLGSQDGLGAYDAVDLQQTWIGNSGAKETQFLHQGNKDLKWEIATTTGAGLDFAFKGGRLSGTVDYFHSDRTNILFYGPVPGGFSATSYYFQNLNANVINKGWEFSVNYNAVKGKKFSWDINYNMSFINNKVSNLAATVNTGAVNGQGLSGAYAQTITNGYSLFTWKMPVFAGFDGNGNQRFANNDPGDKLLGSALPTFTAGLNNSFSLGRWNASIFFNTSRGFYVYNNTANALFLKGSLKTAHNVTNDVASSPESPINPGSVSTRFLEKGDFIRLSNLSVSYSFDVSSIKAIKSLTASLSGQNLLLFTKYTGLDPEVNVDHQIGGYPSRGFDYAGYPKSRTLSLGINVGF
jgi:iron complex outermembrane receptor protein